MNAIVEYIQKYQAANPTGWRKWIIGSVIAVLTVVVMAGYAIQAFMRGRELARLQTERDHAKEALHQAQVNQTLTRNEEEATRHEAAADLALERADALTEEIKQLETRHEMNAATIRGIRSWSDVDKVVK